MIQVGDKIKMNKSKGFELPRVVAVKDNEIVLRRSKQKLTLTIQKRKLTRMGKTFRGAEFSCTIAKL